MHETIIEIELKKKFSIKVTNIKSLYVPIGLAKNYKTSLMHKKKDSCLNLFNIERSIGGTDVSLQVLIKDL